MKVINQQPDVISSSWIQIILSRIYNTIKDILSLLFYFSLDQKQEKFTDVNVLLIIDYTKIKMKINKLKGTALTVEHDKKQGSLSRYECPLMNNRHINGIADHKCTLYENINAIRVAADAILVDKPFHEFYRCYNF